MSDVRTTKVRSIRKGSKQKVYDIGVKKNHNFVANGHIVSNCFQEQFMTLAVELAGFTPGESDKLRKTLVKKSLDTMGKKGDEREAARKKFVQGAKDLHGIDERVTQALWETIEAFSVYGFNKSHAVAYAIDSYYAAWLHTHHEKEWLATILQSENNSPKGLSKTMSEIKSYGYDFVESDVNHSGEEWAYSEDVQGFIPPLSSVKGVGNTAMDEILRMRPYNNLDELFYDDTGSWKHSKVNKTALSSLCKIGAFGSLEEVKTGKVKNHRQLLAMMTDEKNYELLRKGKFGMTKTRVKKAIKNNETLLPVIERLISQYSDLPDWSRQEKILNYMDITSGVDAELLFPSSLMERIREKAVVSIHEIPSGTRGVGWFCVSEVIKKKTKNGKDFHRLKVINDDYQTVWVRVWGRPNEDILPFTIWVADVVNDESWGYSTSCYKMKRINFFD
tara:strand:- start:874 stop:2214 length:1341 start_codon:yes stop_codon:yes gene_type:complete